jgi:hypothetical protein
MAIPLILGAAGAITGIIGAIGKKKEAFNQMQAQYRFADKQRSEFETGYADLLSQAKSAPLYQGDISRFQKVEQQADLSKRLASGMSRGAGEQIARDQASQTTANVLAAAQRGAGSGTDIITSALMAQQGENQAQNAISARYSEQQLAIQNQAQQNQLAALGQTAAASARERGLEFSSLANRQAGIMGVSQNKLSGQLNLNQQLFDGEQAKAAALADANASIWSGIGGLASGLGTGLMGMQNQKANMDMLSKIYGGNKTTAPPATWDNSKLNLIGNPLSGSTGQNVSLSNPVSFGSNTGQQAMSPRDTFESQYSWDPINKQWFSTGN